MTPFITIRKEIKYKGKLHVICKYLRYLDLFSFVRRKVIGLVFAMLHNWLKKFAPIFHPIRSKTKTIVTHSRAFSRTLRQLPVIASSFDWFTVLCVFFVIG